MLKLVIGNSMSRVEGCSQEQFRELKKLLSYEIDPKAAYFSNSAHNPRRYLIDKKGMFPSGLLYIVKKYLFSKPFVLDDTRERPEPRKGLFALSLPNPPYQRQKLAVEAAMRSNGIITMPTGYGKSWTMAMLVNARQVKTLIIVPNLGLKEQLRTSFMELFGSLSNITIENIDSPALKTHGDYGALIIDEAHHSAASTYRLLNKKYWNNIYLRYFFTATPFRSRDEETLLMESITGEVVSSVTYAQAVQDEAIVPMEAFYIDLPKRPVEGNTWAQVYSELVVNNKERNEVIADTLSRLHKAGKSTLCIVKEIKHGRNIQNLLPGYDSQPKFATGEDDSTNKYISDFVSGLNSTLIGTAGVLGEGIDTKPAEYIIIAGLGKSRNQLMQQIGRGLRRYPGKQSCKIIIFRDASHKWSLTHYREQCKVIKDEYGIIPVKL